MPELRVFAEGYNKFRRLKQRRFSRRLRVRLTKEASEALNTIVQTTGISMGKVVEIAVKENKRLNNSPGILCRKIGKKNIAQMLPEVRTVTADLSTVRELSLESRFKHYSCRSFYVGVIFIRVLKAHGLEKFTQIVRSRPDVMEALTHARSQKSREATVRLKQRIQGL